MQQLKFISLISKVCTELENNVGIKQKFVAEFIVEIWENSKTLEEFKQNLKEKQAEFPENFVTNIYNIIKKKIEEEDEVKKNAHFYNEREAIDEEPIQYKIYSGEVTGIRDFGCFVRLDGVRGKREGLCHITQMKKTGRVLDPHEIVHKKQRVFVKVLAYAGSKISLSMKEADQSNGEDLFPREIVDSEKKTSLYDPLRSNPTRPNDLNEGAMTLSMYAFNKENQNEFYLFQKFILNLKFKLNLKILLKFIFILIKTKIGKKKQTVIKHKNFYYIIIILLLLYYYHYITTKYRNCIIFFYSQTKTIRQEKKHTRRDLPTPERWIQKQLESAGVLDIREQTNYNEETGVLDLDMEDEMEEDLEIELNDEEPTFLRGQTRHTMALSPIKILKNPDGSLVDAAMTQVTLAKERKEVREQ
ncbi:nucleolar protein of 40 kda [Anaeramoeba ignava]|uniref:Nucleolar protein of 40 kDa n=1 Tax=Anaeramoeba ignava TaxID=1746090 RepID=A0A9Q0RIS0_ANAIG|nr:nucleolar protein of 40 kda [Anaeramoeba ignava]